MGAAPRRGLLSLPSLRRLLLLAGAGVVLACGAYFCRVWRRPREVPPATARAGLARAAEVLAAVDSSGFGKTERGRLLAAEVRALMDRGALRFSAELGTEALCRRERGCAAVLYVGVYRGPKGLVLPSRGEMAERIFHETLHALKDSERKSREEECDAFCAAAEACAAVEGRPVGYPVTRGGRGLWEWVRDAYPDAPEDPSYRPVGMDRSELARRAGLPRSAER
ncbi:MAG: hypothetical protein ACYTGB_15120 [Planctomycetota bacterium]|jgi:hypothetical protein